jgi:hypothetical protein
LFLLAGSNELLLVPQRVVVDANVSKYLAHASLDAVVVGELHAARMAMADADETKKKRFMGRSP